MFGAASFSHVAPADAIAAAEKRHASRIAPAPGIGHESAMKGEDTPDPTQDRPPGRDTGDRRQREAAALRENLRKRKQQERARRVDLPPRGDDDGGTRDP